VVSSQRVVVVGAGLGGLRAAESLRANGFHGSIVVVGDELWPPYNRPPLSKEALAGDLDHTRLEFRRRPAVDDVEWCLGTPVTAIDVDGRTVRVGEESLGWDALVVATGVSAVRWGGQGPAPTVEAGRHVVRTLDDARALRAQLAPGRRVLVLGAGFIGCEVAATARALGCEVTSVALDPVPMQRPLGPMLGAELRRRHEEHGVAFRLSVGIDRLLGTDHVQGALLQDGTVVAADVVVEALGSRPNVGLLARQGFDLADGVLADSALRPLRDGVPLDGVAVVGDVARVPYPRFDDGAQRVEHWSLPTDTGRRAGEVLATYLAGTGYDDAVARPWDVVPSFWSDQHDLRLQSFGLPGLADPDGARVLEGDLAGECVVGYFRGADLVGVVGLGMLREVMAYRERLGRGRS